MCDTSYFFPAKRSKWCDIVGFIIVLGSFAQSAVLAIISCLSTFDTVEMELQISTKTVVGALCVLSLVGAINDRPALVSFGVAAIALCVFKEFSKLVELFTRFEEGDAIVTICNNTTYYEENKDYCDASAALQICLVLLILLLYVIALIIVHYHYTCRYEMGVVNRYTKRTKDIPNTVPKKKTETHFGFVDKTSIPTCAKRTHTLFVTAPIYTVSGGGDQNQPQPQLQNSGKIQGYPPVWGKEAGIQTYETYASHGTNPNLPPLNLYCYSPSSSDMPGANHNSHKLPTRKPNDPVDNPKPALETDTAKSSLVNPSAGNFALTNALKYTHTAATQTERPNHEETNTPSKPKPGETNTTPSKPKPAPRAPLAKPEQTEDPILSADETKL